MPFILQYRKESQHESPHLNLIKQLLTQPQGALSMRYNCLLILQQALMSTFHSVLTAQSSCVIMYYTHYVSILVFCDYIHNV